ncbi:TOBE domain-containing protein, partial [Rhizobiaceae sp. 2RAB30]
AWLAMRPEHLRVGDTGVRLGKATIEGVIFQGSFRRVLATSLDDPTVRFILHLDADSSVHQGEIVPICCRASDIIVLPE